MKKKTYTVNYIKGLKSDVAYYKDLANRRDADLCTAQKDLNSYRAFHAYILKTAIEISGEGKHWNMTDLIETLTKQLQKVKRFDW